MDIQSMYRLFGVLVLLAVAKGKRLLVPWALAVFVFVPIILYDTPSQLVHPFRSFYPWYLGSSSTQLRLSQTP